ncbi:hypothetical protein LCGC14_2983240 [marine sediment metagenome]|uniref:Peptidase M15C domain-containing protein n=1 Tax=marine sediment metagenome TaxID=412755 RepID=A0A0F8XTI3_9ZZZZ
MASFGRASKRRYETLHYLLQKILDRAIQVTDFSILCGYRNEQEQEEAFVKGNSKRHYPDSKHNQNPSIAVDLVPYPIDWENRDRFIFLAGVIFTIAQQLEIKIRFGGNWSMSLLFEKQKFDDLVHFELVL